MKLAYPLLDKPVEFSEQTVNVLVIENATELRKTVFSLKRQAEGDSGDFVLSENFEPIEISKSVSFITDPFSLELTSKKISGKLTQEAIRAAYDYADDIHRILNDINALALNVGTAMELDASFTELESPDAIIKLLDFCIDEADMSFPEKLLEHMKLQRMFFGKKLFAFYNLKACLSDEELLLFYKAVSYEKLCLLLVEDSQRRFIPGETMVIIDNDLCVI